MKDNYDAIPTLSNRELEDWLSSLEAQNYVFEPGYGPEQAENLLRRLRAEWHRRGLDKIEAYRNGQMREAHYDRPLTPEEEAAVTRSPGDPF